MPDRRRFAEGTEVPVSKTRAELDALLARHGASQRAIFDDDEAGRAVVQFRMAERMARLELRTVPPNAPDPTRADYNQKADCAHGWNSWTVQRRKEWLAKQRDQFAREAWRRLLLVTKAKLEIIADGASTFEREFLADLLLGDGTTVHEAISERLAEVYRTGEVRPLLPAKGETA